MKCKTNSFRKKLISYFMFFTVVIFTVLWLLQTVFLQKFYNGMIIKNTVKVADKISEESRNSDITSYIDDVSRSNTILVFVTDTAGNLLYSSDEYKKGHKFRSDRMEMADDHIERYDHYRELPVNYDEFLSAVNSSDSGEAVINNDDSYVYGRLIDYYGYNDKAVLYLSTPLNAVGSTARIIRIQLLWVTLLSIIIAFVLALFMSKSFSKPVAQLNEKAHKLGEKDDDVDFNEGFCIELDELNTTLDSTSEKLKKNRDFQNELLANVSHDLRTPLTMIKGYAEMIRDISREDEKQRAEDVAVIVEEADRLTALVNEILEYSELQMSDSETVMNDVVLSDTVTSVADSFEKLYSKEGYVFERNIADNIHVKGNAARLQRAVYNLLDNAVRHAGEDKWTGVSLRTEKGNVIIEISDHGSGIAPDELEHIWDRYYTRRQRSGKGVSGLGLAIVKQIVSQHNGICRAESVVGTGSVFSIELKSI
ncbi:MAG TPA: HAMP domain-containing sensor histidine kinase [Ruminococcus flavefaciens]|nr:HAMP domain-containing sensor histidine kinase [Ruminococcus flavefaciens]